MNLHNEIMNISNNEPSMSSLKSYNEQPLAYKYGHRDARHAAAELAIAADARIEELEFELKAAKLGQKLAREELAKLNAKLAEKEIDYEDIAYNRGYTVDVHRNGKYFYFTPAMMPSNFYSTRAEAWKAACEDNGLLGEK